MNTYTTTQLVFFSPTHTSAKIARAVGEGIGMGRRIETDLTLDEDLTPIEIRDALTVIAVPVYGGRVAPVALQRLKRLRGINAPAILITVYGNRDYEDALLELRDTAVELGFMPPLGCCFHWRAQLQHTCPPDCSRTSRRFRFAKGRMLWSRQLEKTL